MKNIQLFNLSTYQPINLSTLFLTIALVGILSTQANAQLDAYAVTRNEGITFNSISGTGTAVTDWRNANNSDNNLSNAITIPFNFFYDGAVQHEVLVSTNGFITFNTATPSDGADPSSYGPNNQSLYAPQTVQTLAPLYQDMDVADLNAAIYYATEGSSPNRTFVVEWTHFHQTGSDGDVTFQVRLSETGNTIEFVYGTMTTNSDVVAFVCGLNSSTLVAWVASFPYSQIIEQQGAQNDITSTIFSGNQDFKRVYPTTNSKLTFTVHAPTAGGLDVTFAGGGIATNRIQGFDYSWGNASTLMYDGSVIVAGGTDQSQAGDHDAVALVKFNPDGSIDENFGDFDGSLVSDLGAGGSGANAVLIQPGDGFIVVAGYADNGLGNQDIMLARYYDGGGGLDLDFGTNGIVLTDLSSDDGARAMVIQGDGKLLVGGHITDDGSGDNNMVVLRYNTDGTLDNTFGTNGVVTPGTGYFGMINAIALQSDGKIVAGGSSAPSGVSLVTVVRLNADGSFDNTFGTGGIATAAPLGISDNAYAIAIQNDGKIVLGGNSWNNFNNDMNLVRFNSNGTLDNTFDSDGMLTIAIGTHSEVIRSIAIQSDGKIIAGGITNNGSDDDFALLRYNTNGSLDNSFDGDGKVITHITSNSDQIASVLLQSDGNIIVAGTADNSVAVGRYNVCGNSLIATATTSASVCSGTGVTLYTGSGSALGCDGLNDYVEVANPTTENLYPLTVSAMVKTSDARSGNYGIVSKYVGGSFNGYNVFMTNGHVYAHYFKDASNYIYDFSGHGIDGGLINDNTWHQIAFTVDASGGKLYVDGVLTGSQAWTGTPGACTTTQPLYIARFAAGYFSGQIDEVRLWNTAESSATLLSTIHIPVAANSSDLIGYWRLDNAAGTSTTDLTGNGNTGTLHGGISWVSPSTSGINPGLTYEWSPSTGLSATTGSSVTATPGADIIYTVKATDASGCVAITSIPVTQHTSPSASLDPIGNICNANTSVPLVGGLPAGGVYSGSGVVNNAIYPAQSGNGSVSVTYTYTDGNGCSASASQTATVGYNSACVQLTQVAAGYCNSSLTNIGDAIYCDAVPGATNYDVQVSNTALGYSQVADFVGTTVFRMTNFPGILYGFTYNVQVSARISGVNGAYGTVCTITTPTTKLANTYCNSIVSSLGDNLYFNTLTGATEYQVNCTNSSLAFDQTITLTSTAFKMINFPGMLNGFTYELKVRAKVSGNYGEYGATCTVTTPTTKLSSGYCNSTINNIGDNIYFDWLGGATEFQVNAINTALGFNQTITATSTVFKMANFTGIKYGFTYDIRVRAKVGGVYGIYGNTCTVTTPTTHLATGYCDVPVADIDDNLYVQSSPGATQYDINVVNVSQPYDRTFTTPGSGTSFRLRNFNNIATLLPGTVYDVKVRPRIGAAVGAWGSVCHLTTPLSLARTASTSPPLEGADATLSPSVSLSAFPNPFTDYINILFTSDETSPAQLTIYDLAGRNIYIDKNFTPNKENMIGEMLEPGMYLIVIQQGDVKKTQRVVKTN